MPSRLSPNYLRAHRKRAFLSQDEIAFLFGFKNGARISRYERGKQTPNLPTLLGYELLFHTPARNLYGGEANEIEHGLKERAKLLIRKLLKSGVSHLNSRKIETLRGFIDRDVPGFQAS